MSRLLIGLVLGMLLVGCSTLPDRLASRANLFDDKSFGAPSVRIDATDVFAMTPAMQRFFEAEIVPMARSRGPQRGLVEALYSAHKLRLDYDTAFTRNAAEAFDERAGNCLSLVIMTATFAKRMGLDVRYQRLNMDDMWSRDGDLVQVVGHVNLALGRPGTPLHRTQSPSDWLTVDFLPIDETQRQRARSLTEATVVAMYMNNKSVEALTSGRTSDAYWWSRASIEHDPTFTSAYITLGVVLNRSGRPELADSAFKFALALEPANPQALSNRVAVLRVLGREDEAMATAHLLARVQPSTPLTAYKSGLAAFNEGDYLRARDAFRTALGVAPDDHEFHFMLAAAYLKLNDDARALNHLRLALQYSPNDARRAAYASKVKLRESLAKPSGATELAR